MAAKKVQNGLGESPLFLLPQFVIIGVWLCFQKKLRGSANLHGSARWAEEREIRTMGYFEGKGVYVGGWLKRYVGAALLLRKLKSRPEETQLYLRHNGPEHIMVFAPTRSGKGVGLILPTLLAWEGSSIVLDIKGENWALTAGFRKSMGHRVLRFDPSDASGATCPDRSASPPGAPPSPRQAKPVCVRPHHPRPVQRNGGNATRGFTQRHFP